MEGANPPAGSSYCVDAFVPLQSRQRWAAWNKSPNQFHLAVTKRSGYLAWLNDKVAPHPASRLSWIVCPHAFICTTGRMASGCTEWSS